MANGRSLLIVLYEVYRMIKQGKIWLLTAVFLFLLAACGGEVAEPEVVDVATAVPQVEEAVAAT